MKYRIAIGQISHETNAFSPLLTDLEAFSQRGLHFGADILKSYENTKTGLGGFLDYLLQHGARMIPTISATAVPSGVVRRNAYDFLKKGLLDRLREEQWVDGVLLALHGAMVVEDLPDPEGDLLKAVRSLLGPAIPVVATLDLHANVTDEMVEYATGLFGYDTNPHVDAFERGLEAAAFLLDVLEGKRRPVMALVKPPLMPPTVNMRTAEGPMVDLFHLARDWEGKRGVINVSVFGGFPFSDIKEAGVGVVALTDGDAGLARAAASDVARLAWDLRYQFLKTLVPPEEAVARAMTAPAGPVVLADVADNPGGGGSGDTTQLLATLLEMDAREVGFALIWDPQAVEEAIRAGVGQEVTLRVGGKTEPAHGAPLSLTGRVKTISDGVFVNRGPMATGVRVEAGRSVLFQTQGLDIVLTENRLAPNDPEIFRHLGVDPSQKKILVLKSRGHFRAAFEPIAREIIEVDCPGFASPNLSWFSYRNVRRPIFPLDKMDAEGWTFEKSERRGNMEGLFAPLDYRGLRLRNRIVMPPMANNMATEAGEVTREMIQHYKKRAKAEVGLVIVEHSYVHPLGRVNKNQLGIHGEHVLTGLRQLAHNIISGRAATGIQITHGGSAVASAVNGEAAVAPSPIPHPRGEEVPRELSQAEMAEIRQAFAMAARRAKLAGFNMVEIHGAHGYLLNQFYSPLTNHRSDDYGGSRENRLRFPLEVVRAVREAVGREFPVFYRLGADDGQPGGLTVDDARFAAPRLVDAGVDVLDISGGLMGSRPTGAEPGYFVPLAVAVKEVVKVPVLVTGGITDPLFAEQLIREGKADLVGIGRALLQDPNWAIKAKVVLKSRHSL